jgi:putative intracellular protease/amidase
MQASAEFVAPRRWLDIEPADYDALLLPGGHAPGMKTYLESTLLREKIAAFRRARSPDRRDLPRRAAAGAHARSGSGRSLLHGRRTTCLPKVHGRRSPTA